MKKLAGIILTDPADLGPALADYRAMLGLTRQQLAQQIADATGTNVTSVAVQLRRWETGDSDPAAGRLGPVLDALGCDLALIPREDVHGPEQRLGCSLHGGVALATKDGSSGWIDCRPDICGFPEVCR